MDATVVGEADEAVVCVWNGDVNALGGPLFFALFLAALPPTTPPTTAPITARTTSPISAIPLFVCQNGDNLDVMANLSDSEGRPVLLDLLA